MQKKYHSKNRMRVKNGEPQVGRKIGTAKARKPISNAEYRLLVAAAKQSRSIRTPTRAKLIAACTLLQVTGCRVSEIVSLHSDDIAAMIRDNEYSLTNATKTGSPRLITLDEAGVQAKMLAEIMPICPQCLFARNGSTEPMTISALTIMLNEHIHRVLGPHYSTHSFRAGYITEAFRAGADAQEVRTDIGHSNISTTLHYRSVSTSEISIGKNRRQWC